MEYIELILILILLIAFIISLSFIILNQRNNVKESKDKDPVTIVNESTNYYITHKFENSKNNDICRSFEPVCDITENITRNNRCQVPEQNEYIDGTCDGTYYNCDIKDHKWSQEKQKWCSINTD